MLPTVLLWLHLCWDLTGLVSSRNINKFSQIQHFTCYCHVSHVESVCVSYCLLTVRRNGLNCNYELALKQQQFMKPEGGQ